NIASPLLTQSENLNGKSVEDLTKLITDLEDAKTKATEAKNLATTNKYSKYVTESDKLINKINEAITKLTTAKDNLEGENKQAEKLIEEIEEKIKNIGDKKALITTDKKEKIDELETLISDLNNANSDGITFHNEKNKFENPLAKRPDVSGKLKELKDLTDGTTTELSQLRQKLSENKKAVEDAFNAAKNKETEKRNSIDKAKVDKKIPELEQALKDLKEIQNRANKAKELESQKGYVAKKFEITSLVTRIEAEILEVEELLRQAKQTEQERIQSLINEINKQITDLNREENTVKNKFTDSNAFKTQIEKLKNELEKAIALKDKVQSETDGNLTEPKKNLSEAITKANATLELAKEKANAIEKIEKLKELTPEQKEDFINKINEATDENQINQITSQAEAKNSENKAKNIADIKQKISELISSLNSKASELENGIGALAITELQKLISDANAIIGEAENYYSQNKNKYIELNADFANLQNAINNAKLKVQKAQKHISSGKQAIDEKLKQIANNLNQINNFINNHNEPKEVDEADWEKQKQLINKLNQEANILKQEIQNKRYDEKLHEIDNLISNINSASNKINQALEKITKQKEIDKAIKDAKEFINSLSWINKDEQSQFIINLDKLNITISEINEIKQNAKAKDDEYKSELEKHREYLGKLNELLKNPQLAKPEYSEIKNELENIINTNKIDLTRYQSDKNSRIHKLKDIKSKNKNLDEANDPILLKIMNKKKELLIKEHKENLQRISELLTKIEQIKISSKALSTSRELGIVKDVKKIKQNFVDRIKLIEAININISTIKKNDQDLDKLMSKLEDDLKSEWFKNDVFDVIKRYCDAVQEMINEFEETKSPNLFSNYYETKDKYAKVYKKYYDEVINSTSANSLRNQIWFSTNPYNLNINSFKNNYSYFTNELIEEMNQINLDQFVKEFIVSIRLKNENNQQKFASELLKNKSVVEVQKLFKLKFKTSKNGSENNEIDLDKLNDKNHLQSKLSKIEEGINIYKDFSFNIESPTFDDIHGLVYIKILGKTTANSKTLTSSKIIRCYTVFKKYFDLKTPQNYNGHSIANDQSILTIDGLIQRMKAASKTITNNKFGDFVEFNGENLNGLKAIVDENSINKSGNTRIEFIVRFIKENVAYVDSNSEDKTQKYKDYEVGFRKYTIDFAQFIHNNRKTWLQNNALSWKYRDENEKNRRKPSDTNYYYFNLDFSSAPFSIKNVSIKQVNPNDLNGTLSLWYDTIEFNDGISKVVLDSPKESNKILGFKTYMAEIQRPKYEFQLNDIVGGFSYYEYWHVFLRSGFLQNDFLSNFNNKTQDERKYIFNKFFITSNAYSISEFDITYNKGQAIFNVKYVIKTDILISKDANGNEQRKIEENKFTDNPSFKEVAMTIRRIRTFNNGSQNHLSNVLSQHYPGGHGKEFDELYNIANSEQKNMIYQLQNELSPAGSHGYKEIFNFHNEVTKQNVGNPEIQNKIKEQYDNLITKAKKLFDSFGTKGQEIWNKILKLYDLTYDGGDGDF
ncbi:hypothetical protein, partial [Metamycoplasma equirhinis]|uniref:hypothetical protein n=1 Tax=Metamycoplasma equirhinis TaxID=92402 RepID=UPI00359310A1